MSFTYKYTCYQVILNKRFLMRFSWDIFCCVVDNFGDIGVTWRLARQLVTEHDQQVRLWVDDMQAFRRLCPEAEVADGEQLLQGVKVQHWPVEWQPVAAADVVIEAFACNLPPAYIEAMAQRTSPPLWLNLEYLSAEDWVGSYHGLPSPQAGGLQKFFFFPGFTAQSGGLLREAGLLERRQRFQQDPLARQAFLQRIGVKPPADARLISLFAYENPALASWLDALAAGEQTTHLIVPEGRVLADVQRWLGLSELVSGTLYSRGALTLQRVAFMSQDDYDQLLWSCDFNAVRGEDSFVRAQWAGRPLLWHIYVQQDEAHLHKMEAFVKLYCEGLTPSAIAAVQAQWRAWNRGEDMQQSWAAVQKALPELTQHAENWCLKLAAQTNISAGLVQLHLKWLKCATKITDNPTLSGY